MNLRPIVSVIIPVRNGKDYLPEAVESVLSQSFTDFELLIVNDGSTDDDYGRYERLDPRIRVIHLSGNGVSRARNTGMSQARGRFFAFLDADDIWFPGKLKAQVNYLNKHAEVGVVFGGFFKWHADALGNFPPSETLAQDCEQLSEPEPERSGWLYTRLLNGMLVGMNTAIIRREVYEAIGGFDESMRQGEDYDFWLKASRVAEMHALNGTMALYRIHAASAMHRLSAENHLGNLLKAASMRWGLNTLDGQSLSLKSFHERLGGVHFDHAYSHYWHGDRTVARGAFWQALRRGHRPLRCLAYIALSYMPARSKASAH
jgi:glycosyltransferase involved in cell wall biosynthesis